MGNECMLGRFEGGKKKKPHSLHIREKGAEAVGDQGESWTSKSRGR